MNAPSVIKATVGSTVIVNFTAQDRNNDTITFSVVNAPEGATNKREGDVFTFTWPVQSSKKVCVTGLISFFKLQSPLIPGRDKCSPL